MRLDDGVTDRQAHPHSPSLGCEECVENAAVVLRADTYAVVPDGHDDPIRTLQCRTYYQAAWPVRDAAHRLDAILDKIHHNLLQLDPVGHHGGEVGREFGHECSLVSGGFRLHEIADFAKQ